MEIAWPLTGESFDTLLEITLKEQCDILVQSWHENLSIVARSF